MRDLRDDLDELWRASGRLTSEKGAKSLLFMSPSVGAGTSSVAASFAMIAAARAKRTTWLVDLDLQNNPVIDAFQERFAVGIGRPGRAYDASFGVMPFFDVRKSGKIGGKPALRTGKLLSAHQVEGTRLLITRFRNERLAQDEDVKLTPREEWWEVLRRSADWVVVDAPSIEESTAGLAIASQMDGVILVVKSDQVQTSQITSLKREIEAANGHVLGVVMNKLRGDSLLADRLTG